MGKGDKKTKRGKIWRGTHGVRRPKNTKAEPQAEAASSKTKAKAKK